MPATHHYRIHPYLTIVHGVTGLAILEFNSRFLYNRSRYHDSVPWGLLGSTPATPRYKERPGPTSIHEIAVLSGGGVRNQAGDSLLDGRLLHNHSCYRNSVSWGLLGSTPATRRYKVRPCGIRTQEIALLCGGGVR